MSLRVEKVICRGRLEDISLEVADGEILVILGAEGEGGENLFRIITGELSLDSGKIKLDGKIIWPREKRETIFEDYILYKRRRKGIYLLAYRQWLKKVEVKKLATVSQIMGIDKEKLLARLPRHLSKGERKRIDLARYLITRREIILLDDPLIGLDWPKRKETVHQLKEILKEFNQPCLYKANSREEVKELEGRVALIRKGRVEYCGEWRAGLNF